MLYTVMDTDANFVFGKGAVLRCTVQYDAYTYGVKGVSELLM
jgi:hypothetical protein